YNPYSLKVTYDRDTNLNIPLHYLHRFFSMTPRLPASTLFPYTTLFRSCFSRSPNPTACRHSVARALRSLGFILANTSGSITFSRDRKSTRLNSSHVATSYAVFCLKKKTYISPSSVSPQFQDRDSARQFL